MVDARTIRDCPGNRTEEEWRAAVRALEEKLQHNERCSKCGHEREYSDKYVVTETEGWLPAGNDLPRDRWALSVQTPTLRAARRLRRFMGSRAVIWVRTGREKNSTTYEKVDT